MKKWSSLSSRSRFFPFLGPPGLLSPLLLLLLAPPPRLLPLWSKELKTVSNIRFSIGKNPLLMPWTGEENVDEVSVFSLQQKVVVALSSSSQGSLFNWAFVCRRIRLGHDKCNLIFIFYSGWCLIDESVVSKQNKESHKNLLANHFFEKPIRPKTIGTI